MSFFRETNELRDPDGGVIELGQELEYVTTGVRVRIVSIFAIHPLEEDEEIFGVGIAYAEIDKEGRTTGVLTVGAAHIHDQLLWIGELRPLNFKTQAN